MKSIVVASVLTSLAWSLALSDSMPNSILGVGAISIDPCQDAKVLADWYAHLGIETKEIQGGYYGQLKTASGALVFGIHPKKVDAPNRCQANIAVVFRIRDFDGTLARLKSNGLASDNIEQDAQGRFAHFHDPDGNKVSLWEQ